MKKSFAAVLVFCLLFTVFAGGSQEKKTDGTFRVGIVQLVQHVALDDATRGFRDALVQEFGDKVVFDEQNASGEPNNCATIVNGFLAENVDLIMANATPALQAAASATSTVPILGTSVTHYAVALDIDNWTGTVGTNVSGTSDLPPLDEQARMIVEWFPNAKKVGLLFCSAEANSIYQVEEIERHLASLGLDSRRFSFTDTNDIASVTQRAADWSDVVYIPTDNTASSNKESIANVLVASGVPAICGEEGLCAGCGVATLSIDYYDLGIATGRMAARILRGEAKVSEMPIEYAPVTKKYEANMCRIYGITPVAGYEPF